MKNIKPKHKRLFVILIWLSILICSVAVILSSLTDNISYYYTPSEINKINKNSTNIRVGGIVSIGSLKKFENGKIEFEIESIDKSKLKVILSCKKIPMIFREGQGVIVKGKFSGNDFIANEIITKHDEKYFPPDNNSRQ